MPITLLTKREEDGFVIEEYTKDGVNVSHVVKVPIIVLEDLPESSEPKPTLEEQILAENQYQTALLEMQMLGGM